MVYIYIWKCTKTIIIKLKTQMDVMWIEESKDVETKSKKGGCKVI